MQLNRNAEIAVKVLIDLAQHGASTAGAIGRRRAIPRPYAFKVLRRMRDRGLVAAKRGKGGGYRLTLDPKDITLWQVITLMQGPVQRNRCLFSADGQCRIAHPCEVYRMNAVFGTNLDGLLEAIRGRPHIRREPPKRTTSAAGGAEGGGAMIT